MRGGKDRACLEPHAFTPLIISITVLPYSASPAPPPQPSTQNNSQMPLFVQIFFFRQEMRRGKRFTFDGSRSKAPEVFVPSFLHCASASFRRHAGFCLIKAAARQPFRRNDFSTQMAFYARVGAQPSAPSARLLTEGQGLPWRHTWICDWGGFAPSSLRSVSHQIW